MESDHFEREGFLSEVGGSAETGRQVDPPDGLCSLPWHDSMEAPDAGLEVRPRDPQKVKGLGIDDVKTAIAIHEHLGMACVGDNGIDNKWVDPRIGDVVRVVITVESDGHLGPVKKEGGCELHGEDLSTFLLALP
jgi:predicted ABC-class ATPase